MFRSETMRKATVVALNKHKHILLNKLQKLGVMQIQDLKGSELDEEISAAAPPEELKTISDQLITVSRMVHVMNLVPVKLTLAKSMFGLELLEKQEITDKPVHETLKEIQEFIDANNDNFVELESKYNAILEEEEELKKVRETVEVFSRIGVPPYLLKPTEHTFVIAGRISTASIAKLRKELEEVTNKEYVMNAYRETKKDSILIIITHKDYASNALFLTKKYNLDTFSVQELPEKDQLEAWVNKRIKALEEEKKQVLKQIAKLRKKHFKTAVALREELEVLKNRYEQIYNFLDSQNFFVLRGWTPKSEIIKLKEELRKEVNGNIIVLSSKPDESDVPPVKLTNPKWLQPFEALTELFALPNYKDLDPTFIVGPVFLVFAGFMLTDFFYGLGLALLGAFLIKKFGKYNKGLKDMAITVFFIGFFSMIFGVLTGSYLGDAPKYIIGKSASELAIWKDPLAEPLYFLIVALSVALIHLNIGLLMGVMESVRKRDFKDLISEKVVWWVLQAGVALLALKIAPTAGKVLLGIAVLIVIIFKGPIGVLGITGFMGDVISYSRLFALALSTAGIALTVNLLANMVSGIAFVGVTLAIIIAVVGHIFSFLMNSLGAFVHSIRLQFVEFFGKFYEGGGDKYTPFAEERLYTKVVRKS